MERRVGLRGRTDFSVTTTNGFWATQVRGVELSGSGLVADFRRPTEELAGLLVVKLEIVLPERHRPIVAVARQVRARGTEQAFRFVTISDVDRLCLAEHLDLVQRRGVALH